MVVEVRVPATSANLGPGFDVLGLALPIYNTIRLASANELTVRFTGPEAGGLPADGSNLALVAAARLCAAIGRDMPAWDVTMDVQLPQSRGLGSSSAAIVAGLVAANAWFDGPMDLAGLLALATAIEGHPDNVAPALYGGVTAAWGHGDGVGCAVLTREAPATMVVTVPEFKLSTAEARAVLPPVVPRADAIANVAAVTLLTTVMLTGRVEYFAAGLADRLHQPYRLALVPGAEAVFTAARGAGAHGSAISGAGPTLLHFVPPAQADAVAEATVAAWRGAGIASRALVFPTLAAGAAVLPETTPCP